MILKGKIDTTEKSALVNMVLKPISAILSLIYTPILLQYLGNEKYGLWATILSIITWINFFDVGIGNGLRNLLSRIIAEGKKDDAKKSVATAYIMLTIIAVVLFCILLCIGFIADWSKVFSTTVQMRPVMIITFAFVCINFVLALSNTLLYSLNQSEKVSVRNCLAQLLNIIGILVIREFSDENLVAMSILFGGSSTVLYIWNSILIFRAHPFLVPTLSDFDRSKVEDICSVGIEFFIIQLMGLLLFTTDNIIITHFLGAEIATPFAITNKVFNTMYAVFAAFIVPYWSRTTVAVYENDIKWIKNSIKKVFMVGGVFICSYIGMGFVFYPVMKFWLNRELYYQPGLVLVMIVFYIFYTVLGAECQFINGTGHIRIQLIVYIIIGVANIPLSLLLGIKAGLGSMGIRLATTLLVGFAIVVLGINLKKIINKMEMSVSNNL